MENKKPEFSRRDFLRTAGAAGVGSVLAPYAAGIAKTEAAEAQGPGTIPVRPFGKTGVNVSILSLGGMFDIPSNQIILKQALRLGITYWDTANSYGYGKSEKGIGKFFKSDPEARRKVFLVTKSGDSDPDGLEEKLGESLERMNTSYIDLFFVHGIRSISEIDDKTRAWAEKAKKQGRIKFFGFSTHRNMERCLLDAARLDWIDGIMLTYNFRIMHEPQMKEAVAACKEAGIGLTAMKTQGGGPVRTNSEAELELAGQFVQKGFTPEQAKLLAVWQEPYIASLCSQMPSMNILAANAAAAMKKTSLTSSDMRLFEELDRQTASDYCAGCGEICEPAMNSQVPVCDVMRYLMYSRNYGEKQLAAELFSEIPAEVRRRLAESDYSAAEKKCPRNLAIGRLMREAVSELA